MAPVWDDDEQASGFRGGLQGAASRGGDTLVCYAATDRTAYRRASGVRRMADGGRRLPAAPQAIGRLLVLLAGLGVVLLMCAVLWVGLGLVVAILLRVLGP